MRYVDRSRVAPPAYLSSPQADRARRAFLDHLRLSPIERAQTKAPDRHLPTDPTIAEALAKLFDGKCAFCESRVATSPYRFRPTSDARPAMATGEAHLYYGWLADAWENLYPICAGCRPSAASYFPVRDKRMPVPDPAVFAAYVERGDGRWPDHAAGETALLIDPCEMQDMGRHFDVADDGVVIGWTRNAAETIEVFRLNRTDLADRRAAAFKAYRKAEPGPEAEFAGLWSILRRGTGRKRFAHPMPKAKAKAMAAPFPRLARIDLTNFKALESLTITLPPRPSEVDGPPLAQALLILGENATGKSSILEGIALALVGDDARAALKVDPAKILLDPGLMGAEHQARRKTGSVRLTFEDGSTRALKVAPDGFAVDGDPAALPPVFAYGAYRHYLSDTRRWSPERPVISLFRSDNLLSNPEGWLLGLTEARFNMVVRALRDIFGAAESFNVIERDPQAKVCHVVTELREGTEDTAARRVLRTPLASVSSGFRTILALTCDVMRWVMDKRLNPGFDDLTAVEGVVLIDEVEAHLHPRWKIQIMTGLRRALPGMTFIVTTHDPLCLRGMRDGEVKVLNRVPGEAMGSKLPVMVETLIDLPNVSRLTVEQLLTSDLFSLFSTDDPDTEQKLARLGDYLARTARGETPRPEAREAMEALRAEIVEALPVGRGEAARLVQEVVAEYLVNRRAMAETDRRVLRQRTKDRIRAVLENL